MKIVAFFTSFSFSSFSFAYSLAQWGAKCKIFEVSIFGCIGVRSVGWVADWVMTVLSCGSFCGVGWWYLTRRIAVQVLFVSSCVPCSHNCPSRQLILFLFPGVSHACSSITLNMSNYLNIISSNSIMLITLHIVIYNVQCITFATSTRLVITNCRYFMIVAS